MGVDYLNIINSFNQTNPFLGGIYFIHVTLVTSKALKVCRKLGLSEEMTKFIEEASMLHDIGMFKVAIPELGINSGLPYLCHGYEGYRYLKTVGLPKHARIALRHDGTGLTKEDIIRLQLPEVPRNDYLPETLEERIIAYADCFYGKRSLSVWYERTPGEVTISLEKLGIEKALTFQRWHEEFA
jgi:uncharacterized protein